MSFKLPISVGVEWSGRTEGMEFYGHAVAAGDCVLSNASVHTKPGDFITWLASV